MQKSLHTYYSLSPVTGTLLGEDTDALFAHAGNPGGGKGVLGAVVNKNCRENIRSHNRIHGIRAPRGDLSSQSCEERRKDLRRSAKEAYEIAAAASPQCSGKAMMMRRDVETPPLRSNGQVQRNFKL